MTDKVEILRPELASPVAVLADAMGREGLDGVVVMARINDEWATAWSAGVSMGSLCMASMKLQSDVIGFIHDNDLPRTQGEAS